MGITKQMPKVLIVDDEPIIADTLAVILRKAGYQTTTAYNGTEALQKAIELEPDMVITDVMMPDVSGIDTAVQIKAILPQCKVLLFSGQAASADLLAKSRRDGHDFDLLSKPIHPQDLINRLTLVIPGLGKFANSKESLRAGDDEAVAK